MKKDIINRKSILLTFWFVACLMHAQLGDSFYFAGWGNPTLGPIIYKQLLAPASEGGIKVTDSNIIPPPVRLRVPMSDYTADQIPADTKALFFRFQYSPIKKGINIALFSFEYDDVSFLEGTLVDNTLSFKRYFDRNRDKYYEYKLYDKLFDLPGEQSEKALNLCDISSTYSDYYRYIVTLFVTKNSIWIEVENGVPYEYCNFDTRYPEYGYALTPFFGHSTLFWGFNVPGSSVFSDVFGKFVARDSKAVYKVYYPARNGYTTPFSPPELVKGNLWAAGVGSISQDSLTKVIKKYIDTAPSVGAAIPTIIKPAIVAPASADASPMRNRAIEDVQGSQLSPEIKILHNPVRGDNAIIRTTLNSNETVELKLLNANGVSLTNLSYNAAKGVTDESFSIPSGIPNGIYFISCRSKSFQKVMKISISR